MRLNLDIQLNVCIQKNCLAKALEERLQERFLEFKEGILQESPYNPYCIWLPLVSTLRTERREEVISLGNCFSFQNQLQAMQINLAA